MSHDELHDIQCVIFDLDSCICDSREFRKHVIRAMKDALPLEGEERKKAERLIEAESSFSLLNESGLPPHVHEAVFEAYRSAEISRCEIKTFGDEQWITRITAEKILVTAGFENLQWAKIAWLQIAHLFSEIHIDIVRTDWTHGGKEPIFKKLMESRGLHPQQIAVIGDNPLTELGAGKRLGMVTIQTLRPGVVRWDEADYVIESLDELPYVIPMAFRPIKMQSH